jgi:hypothetical protein
MKSLKWVIVFTIAFAFAWVTIFTFNQEPFRIQVPAKLILWQTRAIPVYFYLVGAFVSGLFIGLFIAFYNKIVFSSKLKKKIMELRIVNQDVDILKQELEQYRMSRIVNGENPDSDKKEK